MLTQCFKITSNKGLKDNCTASYQVDTDKALISISYALHFSWYVPLKDSSGQENNLPLPLNDILSSNFNAVGKVLSIPIADLQGQVVSLTVTGLSGTVATCSSVVTVQGKTFNGTGQVDISGQYIKILSLEVTGSYFGLGLDIKLTPQ